MINAVNKPYSAEVILGLLVDDKEHSLAKTGPDRVYLRTPVNLPPCDAEVVVNIDGQIRRRKVRLPKGTSDDSAIVEIC